MPSFLPRSLVPVAALGLIVAARPAHAQVPAPTYAPPTAYAPMAQPAPGYWAPPAPVLERRSPALVTAGAVLIAIGTAGAIAGASMLAVGTSTHYEYPPCPADVECAPTFVSHTGLTAGGAVVVGLSLVSLAVGIPLLATGQQKVAPKPAASLVPTLRVGAGGGVLSWQLQ
jgi:hypothetical protein